MQKRKAQMALEYIAKLIIILVVITVVMGMIFYFKNDITEKWKIISNPGGDDEPEPNAEFVEGTFTATDFANFIELCWEETRDAKDSRVCFVLKGNAAPGVDETTITQLLDSEIAVDFTSANFGDDMFSINYELLKNEIHVKS